MANEISPTEVRRVAKLARLELSENEVADFSTQLTAILEFFEQLQASDTQGVEPITHPIPLQDALRDDLPRPCLDQHLALQNAPESRDGYFRVPAVLGGGGGN